jgi:hypothetical protein
MRFVIRTSIKLGADIASTSLHQLRLATIYPVRGDEGVDVVCGDFALPDSDVTCKPVERKGDRGVEIAAIRQRSAASVPV